MKEKPGADPVKMSNNEAKLTAARQRLHEATSRLYKGFGYYDAVGGKLVQPEVEMFKKAQQDFFGAALEAVRWHGMDGIVLFGERGWLDHLVTRTCHVAVRCGHGSSFLWFGFE